MKANENPASYLGHVKNGVIVPDVQTPLKDGQAVRIEVLAEDGAGDQADRVRKMQQLFTEWTEEDGKLSDEEADRLREALAQTRGLLFRTPTTD